MVIKITEPKRFSISILLRKLTAVILVMLIYYNLIFWLILPQIFANPIILTILIIYYTLGAIDIMIRPIPEKIKITTVEKMIVLMGLLQPFILIVAYLENLNIIARFILFWNDPIVAYIGIIFMIFGGIIMITSRIQLGKYGTPVVHTGEEHKLVTKGLYKIVRHPMYFGAIFMMLGIYLAFRSIFVLVGMTILYFFLMKIRIQIEEETLIGTFGKEYRDYINRTKKLIPFIY